MSCGSHPTGPRWYAAWTHPGGEFRAELHLAEQGFTAYLPLHLDLRFRADIGHGSIVPLFRGYLFVEFAAERDGWRRIYRTRGIAGLIGETADRPTPLGPGIIEELIGRTSPRRIVDDPGAGAVAFPDPAAPRKHWRNLAGLSGKERRELLLGLFGRGAEIAA